MNRHQWAANEKAPLTREEQIHLMQTAKQRHEEFIKKVKELYYVQHD